MIYVKLHGRLGNYLFQLGAAATLAKKLNVPFSAVTHNDYLLKVGGKDITVTEYAKRYRSTILNSVNFEEKVLGEIEHILIDRFVFRELPLKDNICLDGALQSYRYLNPQVVNNLFQLPASDRKVFEKLKNEFDLTASVGIHVRRGDYLEIPHKFPVISKSYIENVMSLFENDTKFVVFSDDIEWCKTNITGDYISYFDTGNELYDLFGLASCKSLVLSNSTFAWWGAYLNIQPGLRVYYPLKWFGISREVRDHDISYLCPPNWIGIKNRMNLFLQIKALYLHVLDELIRLKTNICAKFIF